MAIISVKNLLEAGVHFGHRASRWNPKMAPYIYGKRNLIYIINLRETVKGIVKAHHFLSKVSAEGHEILFVGTKRQAKPVIRQEAQRCNMHYVSERWLGGTLTNFETIRKRLARLEELEEMEEHGTMDMLSKKMGSSLRREKRKIHRNLEGIRNMTNLPSALIVIDPQKERIAVLEALKLGIPTIALMDTDSNPDLVDIPIPCNDDAMRSIEVICSKLTEAIIAGNAIWQEKKLLEEKKKQEAAANQKQKGGHSNEGDGRESQDKRRTDSKRRGGGGGGDNKKRSNRKRSRKPFDKKSTEQDTNKAASEKNEAAKAETPVKAAKAETPVKAAKAETPVKAAKAETPVKAAEKKVETQNTETKSQPSKNEKE